MENYLMYMFTHMIKEDYNFYQDYTQTRYSAETFSRSNKNLTTLIIDS